MRSRPTRTITTGLLGALLAALLVGPPAHAAESPSEPEVKAAEELPHDHGTDGPTLPLTRELPVASPSPIAPRRLTVPEYGPQPVFRLPYAAGARWAVSGSHADSDGIHRGAIDFAPTGSASRSVLAVASGTVYRVTCGRGWFLGVDHGGGWMSEYYHLENARAGLVGSWVEAGTRLGDAAQTLPCGGTPGSRAHVHLSILNEAVDVPSGKRSYVPVDGVQFDGYTLRDTSGAYNGVWRDLSGDTVVTSRGIRCCLTASSGVGPQPLDSPRPDADGDGVDDDLGASAVDTDLNSDGAPDIVAFGSVGVYTSAGTGRAFTAASLATSAFGSSRGWDAQDHPRVTVDVTGDGRPDIVGFGPGGVYVAPGAPGKFASARLWVRSFGTNKGWRVGVHQRSVVDVTGDGRPDIVGFGPAGVHVARNIGSSFETPRLWTGQMGSSASAGGWNQSRTPRTVVDVTGDGLADLVGFGTDGVYVARNTGGAFDGPRRWVGSFGAARGWSVAGTPRHVIDADGDGRPDIVGFGPQGVWVAKNTGDAFASPTLWSRDFRSAPAGTWRTDRHPRTLADVDGDGRADIVGFASAGTYVAINQGSSFSAQKRWTRAFGSREWTNGWMPRTVVDINRDGRADIVGFGRDGVQTALSTGSRFGAATHGTRSYGWHASARSWRVTSHVRMLAF